jgi:hypothetical protein
MNAETGRKLALAQPAIDPPTDKEVADAGEIRERFETAALHALVRLHLLLQLRREGLERI